ncbi:MAG: SAM-dependent methyltransferase [Chloroflexi bacterium]|nr:SAM-dependent methyltransferase [Chloroflexota bacterium]MDL1941749.1 methyltransferase domain-containing protein [Chloroflexi bacterium CFX2]
MTSQFSNPAELYEKFYGPAIFQPLAEILVEFAAPKPGERVLDLACGTGLVARRAAPLIGAGGKLLAVDINPAMLEVARRQPAASGAAIEWLEGDATRIDLPNHEFDLIFCQQGLQFFSDRLAALQRMKGLLAPGGRVALATWQEIEQHPIFAEFAKVESRHLAPLGVSYDDLVAPFSLGKAEQVRALLEEAGFSRIQIAPATVETRFHSPETFARNMETAYGAVIPAFVEDRAAFMQFLDAVERETQDLVRRYTQDGMVRFPMPANLAMAYAE